MKQAYTPALQILPRTKVSKLRELPLTGRVLVQPGDEVKADTAVLAADLPGDLTIVRIADRLGFDPTDVAKGLKVCVGESVKRGELLCEIRTFFNLFSTKLHSSVEGLVEFFTEANGHLGIRQPSVLLTINAYLDGRVVEAEEGKAVTIETEGALIQGIFGVGGERLGRVFALPFTADMVIGQQQLVQIEEELTDAVLIGGASFTLEALNEAARRGAVAVVTGSIDAETLHRFVGFEIGVSVTGDEEVPLTLIITEGFGFLPISERVVSLANSLQGQRASVNGATQVRAGATRPEVVVPLKLEDDKRADEVEEKTLDIGQRVRLIRVPYFGMFGTISELPPTPEKVESGAIVRVLKVRLDSGEQAVVPRANVELV